MRFLAIDHGNRRTGLAVCDAEEKIVVPLTIVENSANFLIDILSKIEENKIEAVVVGLPLNMDDSEGEQAKRVRAFAQELESQIEIPIHFQDERLSTFEAEEKFSGVEMKRKQKRKHLDAVAAAGILEAFLQSKRENTKF